MVHSAFVWRAGALAASAGLALLASSTSAAKAPPQSDPVIQRTNVTWHVPRGLGLQRQADAAPRAGEDPLTPALAGLLSELRFRDGRSVSAASAGDDRFEAPRIARGNDGFVRSVGAPPGFHFVSADRASAASPAAVAAGFVSSHGELFGLSGQPFGLAEEVVKPAAGRTFVKLGQSYHGVPVLGARAIVQVDESGGVEFALLGLARRSRFPASGTLDITPVVAADAAGQLATAALGEEHPGASLVASQPQLVVYDPALLGNAGPVRLAWRLTVTSSDESRPGVVVTDSTSGLARSSSRSRSINSTETERG